LLRSHLVSSRIKTLSLQLANQIAAGEVVERPASVVKELLENAIDAHSSQIQIDIERGGSALIRISDNGDGIDKDDLPLALSRHATSKLKSLAELEQIMSLGFRGEALASISAVSKLLLKSKQREQSQAWMINTATGGDFANYRANVEPAAHPQGTTIEVRDLFFNTPARRKFMRTVKTEFRHIEDMLKRIALSRYDIAFKLLHNKKLIKNLPVAITDKAITQRIAKLFSSEFLRNSVKLDYSADHFSDMSVIRLWGWVSQAQWHRKQADWQYFYVNGRYIKDKLVNHALRQVYQDCLPEDSFSAYLLYLEIDPQQVDVNVHPTKHEVRFRQTRLIHDFIYSALKQVIFPDTNNSPQLGPHESLTMAAFKPDEHYKQDYGHRTPTSSHYAVAESQAVTQQQVSRQLQAPGQLYRHPEPAQSPPQQEISKQGTSQKNILGRPLGCFISGYLVSYIESKPQDGQLLLIHIVRAQQFLLNNLYQVGQELPLLIPQTISLNRQHIDLLMSKQMQLAQWGIEFSQLSSDSIMVRQQPFLANIPGCNICLSDFFQSLNEALKIAEKIDEKQLLATLIDSLYSDELAVEQQIDLLAMLEQQINISDVESLERIKPRIWKRLDKALLDKLLG